VNPGEHLRLLAALLGILVLCTAAAGSSGAADSRPQLSVTGFAVGGGPIDISAGADGNLWFTQFTATQIGRITPAGAVTEFPARARPLNGINSIARGPDGNIWYLTYSDTGNHNRIGRITPTGAATLFESGADSPFGGASLGSIAASGGLRCCDGHSGSPRKRRRLRPRQATARRRQARRDLRRQGGTQVARAGLLARHVAL
jgi:streptogramin lyase